MGRTTYVGVAQIKDKMREGCDMVWSCLMKPLDAPVRRCEQGMEMPVRRDRGRRRTWNETIRKDMWRLELIKVSQRIKHNACNGIDITDPS